MRGQLLTTDQKMTGLELVLHRPIVISSLAVEVIVAGAAGSVVRLGIAGDNGGGYIDQRILDAGTVAATATGKAEIANFRQFLNPGVYWLLACPQGAPATNPVLRSLIEKSDGLQSPGTGFFGGDVFGSGILTNHGQVSVPAGVNPVFTVPHGLAVTPRIDEVKINVTLANQAPSSASQTRPWGVTATDATNITIQAFQSTGAGSLVDWSADCRQSTAEFAKTGWTATGVSAGFPDPVLPAPAAVTPTAGEAILVGFKVETVEPV